MLTRRWAARLAWRSPVGRTAAAIAATGIGALLCWSVGVVTVAGFRIVGVTLAIAISCKTTATAAWLTERRRFVALLDKVSAVRGEEWAAGLASGLLGSSTERFEDYASRCSGGVATTRRMGT